MINRRMICSLLAAAGVVGVSGIASAKGPHKHIDGHAALGGKLKQNGKHSLGKAGTANVEATVSGGKVTAMSATDAKNGNIPAKKVKTRKKMASMESSRIQVASNEALQYAQTDVYYYGWGFDTGVEEVYYWYPASDVVVEETWVEYTV